MLVSVCSELQLVRCQIRGAMAEVTPIWEEISHFVARPLPASFSRRQGEVTKHLRLRRSAPGAAPGAGGPAAAAAVAAGFRPGDWPWPDALPECAPGLAFGKDRKSTRLNSSHTVISYAVFCLKKK